MFYYNGYGENALTFSTNNTGTTKGAPVNIKMESIVQNSNDGEDFIGICKDVNSITATVIMDGYIEVHYTGTEPTYNYCGLVGDGKGGVKTSATAKRNYKVLKVDKNENIVGFIL